MSEKPPVTPLGRIIRRGRANLGWSLQRLADECGVSKTWLGHIERGYQARGVSAQPGESTIIAISTALGLDVNETLAVAGYEPVEIPFQDKVVTELWPRLSPEDRSRFEDLIRRVVDLQDDEPEALAS